MEDRGSRRDDRSPRGRYFGAPVSKGTLLPGEAVRLGKTRFEDWLAKLAPPIPSRPPHPAPLADV